MRKADAISTVAGWMHWVSNVSLAEPAPLPFLARRPAYLWFVVGTVCVGAFMGQLDASIAQLVLPTLETSFHARLSLVDWVALAHLLALGATLSIFGRLADMVGRKLLYTGGFLVFVAGSALCGLAPHRAAGEPNRDGAAEDVAQLGLWIRPAVECTGVRRHA